MNNCNGNIAKKEYLLLLERMLFKKILGILGGFEWFLSFFIFCNHISSRKIEKLNFLDSNISIKSKHQ